MRVDPLLRDHRRAQGDLAAQDGRGDDLGELAHLAGAVAAQQFEALALGRKPCPAAVGGLATNRAAIPLAERLPLLLTPAIRPPRFETCRIRNMCSGVVCISPQLSSGGIAASAVMRLPRVARMLTCELFLSVAKLDSRQNAGRPGNACGSRGPVLPASQLTQPRGHRA